MDRTRLKGGSGEVALCLLMRGLLRVSSAMPVVEGFRTSPANAKLLRRGVHGQPVAINQPAHLARKSDTLGVFGLSLRDGAIAERATAVLAAPSLLPLGVMTVAGQKAAGATASPAANNMVDFDRGK